MSSPALAGLTIDPEKLAQLDPAERELVAEELRVVEEAFKRNPLLGFRPHLKGAEFMGPPHPRARLFLGGNRAGKTTHGMGYGIVQQVDRDVVPEHLLRFKRWDPPTFGRVVIPDLTSTMEGVVLQKIREWCPASQLKGGSVDRAFEKQQRLLKFKNGSWIQFMSNDQDLDKFGGTALHWVLFDEEPRKDVYHECLMRLIDYDGEALFTMTPLHGMCVDTQTECLTKHGWKRHFELEIGEPVLTYNVERGATEWAPLLGVYRDENYDGAMCFTPGHLNSMFTPDHKWVTERGLVPWSELKKTDRAVVARPHCNVNVDTMPPAFWELLGWFMAEGSVVRGGNKMVIYQSASRYPEHCATITRLLEEADAQHHVMDSAYRYDQPGQLATKPGVIRRFVITGDVARQLRFVVGYPKRLRPEVVSALSEEGLRALLAGLLGGDGHICASGKWEFTTVDKRLADAVSMVGLLLGRRTNIRRYASPSIVNKGRPVFRVTASERERISEFKRYGKLVDAPVDGVWCPCTPNQTWVARRGGTAFITGNSWVYDTFFEPWERKQLEPDDVRITIVDMDDNPHLSEHGKQIALQGLSPEEKQARKSGRFVAFAGLIYPEWSVNDHVVPQPHALPPGVEVFCGIDPGYRHLCVVLYAYLDHEDNFVVFDEIAAQRTIISTVCKEIQVRNERWGIRPNWYVIDPAAQNKNGQTGRNDQQEFADHGIYTIPGQNAVRPGINHVKERLSAGKLQVAGSCTELISEFKKYRWVRDSSRSEDDPREKPVKRDDHALDCLRYLVMARPLAPSEPVPLETLTMKDRLLRHHLKRLRKPAPADNGFGPGIFA